MTTMKTITTMTTETVERAMNEVEALNKINENLVRIGNVQNLILGILIIAGVYLMFKIAVKFFSRFL